MESSLKQIPNKTQQIHSYKKANSLSNFDTLFILNSSIFLIKNFLSLNLISFYYYTKILVKKQVFLYNNI